MFKQNYGLSKLEEDFNIFGDLFFNKATEWMDVQYQARPGYTRRPPRKTAMSPMMMNADLSVQCAQQ